MLWEKPHRCPTCKNTKWDIYKAKPTLIPWGVSSTDHSSYVCLICARVLPVAKDLEHNQLFFKPFPWRVLAKKNDT
jgi:hypothetical protein